VEHSQTTDYITGQQLTSEAETKRHCIVHLFHKGKNGG